VNQAEARAAAIETDLRLAQQAFAAQQNTVKALLSDNFKTWADVQLEPTDKLTMAAMEPSRLESWGIAMKLRPDLLQFRVEMEKMDLAVRYRFNQLFPSLDLTGSYGAVGVQGALGASWDDVRDVHSPAYSYGAILSVPLTRVAERNQYKNSKAARKQAELQLKKLEQEILVQVDNALTALRNAGQRVKSTHQGRLYAEAALDAENRKFEAGMSTVFLVEEMQRMLTMAQSSEIRALADYNAAVVQLAFSEGSTLERNHLSVEVK
jgi:outer membrane protein TolC